MNKFKQNLKMLRIEKGLSQLEFANIIGFARTTVADWELKGTEPNYDTLIKIAKLFDVSIDYLLGIED